MLRCSHCSESNLPRARFCMGCGSALMPAQRAEELRRVTVLFADIAGSTAMISGADPELARARLEPIVRRITSAIIQCGGTIARIAGDGVKALFGAPIVLEEHAVRACLAALRIQGEVAAGASSPGPTVRIRIGINTGTVLLCSVATDLHVEYAAEGVTTHLAAKAQQLAHPGTTLITADVAEAIDGYFETAAHEPLRLAGLDISIALFQLLRATGARSRFDLALRRGLTRLIGRDGELAWLDQLATRSATDQRLALAALVGEAGVGKSRLLWEFRQRLVTQGWKVAAASGTRGGASIAFLPVLTILQDLYDLLPDDDAAAIRAKLSRAGGAPLDLAPLLVLFDRDPDDPTWPTLDPGQRVGRTRVALAAALEAACSTGPTAIVVDGLDDADAETRDFFEVMSRRAKAVSLLVLLEGRPAAVPTFERHAGVSVLSVEPLKASSASLMFRSLAGVDPSLRRLEGQILLHTAGNPFFMEECVRTLRESGTLTGASGALRATSGSEVQLPASVLDIVETRIVRLPLVDRETLQVAAVVGREISIHLVSALLDVGPVDLSNRLHRLVEAGLLVVDGDGGVERFAFRHAVTQDVAYRLITRTTRLNAHCRLAQTLESLPYESLPERIELLAHHSLRGHDWRRALIYLQLAAQRAAERSAPREVVRLLDEALNVLAQLPADDRSVDREIEIRLAMSFPLIQLGHLERTAAEVAQLELLEAKGTDRRLQGRVAVFVSTQRWLSGEHLKAVAIGRRALQLGQEFDDPTILVPARQCVGGALNEAGYFSEALTLLSLNIDALDEATSGQQFGMAGLPAVFARSTRSWVYTHMGQFADAEPDAMEALRIADANGHAFSFGSAAFAFGALALARGESAAALPLLEQGVLRCESARLRMWLPVAASMLALAHVESGQLEWARQVIDRAVPKLDDTVIKSSFICLALVRVFAAIGRREEALGLWTQTLARARVHGGRTWEAEAMLAGADICESNAAGDARAQTLYEQGLDIASQLGMACVAARCRLGLAALARRRGQHAAADAGWAAARQLLEACAAPGWVRAAQPSGPDLGARTPGR